jgi:metal-sulfur cluster biosynthetic enzyme
MEEMTEALREVYDPEIPINIVDLGLIYRLEEKDGAVAITMTLTSPFCPLADTFREQVSAAIQRLPGITTVNVSLTFDPPWTKEKMTKDGKIQAAILGFM